MDWPPEDAKHVVTFIVFGEPKPAGSKKAGVVYRTDQWGQKVPATYGDGRIKTFVQDMSGDAGKTWRGDIRDAIRTELGTVTDLLDGPLVIETRFFLERPKSHYGTGKNAGILKPNAPRYPHKGRLADGGKLARAVEDALTDVLVTDDRRFCRGLWMRDYGRARAEVTVWCLSERLPAEVAAVADSEQIPLLAVA